MIVVDASALFEFLLQTSIGVRVEERIFRDADQLHAPHVVDVLCREEAWTDDPTLLPGSPGRTR